MSADDGGRASVAVVELASRSVAAAATTAASAPVAVGADRAGFPAAPIPPGWAAWATAAVALACSVLVVSAGRRVNRATSPGADVATSSVRSRFDTFSITSDRVAGMPPTRLPKSRIGCADGIQTR